MRTHAQTAGVSLTAQQPYNNIVRVALQALGSIRGHAVVAYECAGRGARPANGRDGTDGPAYPADSRARDRGNGYDDPLGGSYYVETLTDALEQKVYEYFRKLDELGGMVRAIELGFPQREISEAAYRSQQKLEKKEDIIVGVNDFVTGETPLEILTIEPRVEQEQIARVQHLRQGRDHALLRQKLQS